MAPLIALWVVIAASMTLAYWLMVRLDRRLARLKMLGAVPASTPAMFGSEAGFRSTTWLYSAAATQIGDPVVAKLVKRLRWLTVAQFALLACWIIGLAAIAAGQ